MLADGVRIAAERIGKGADQYAIHVGGQELPMHDPRFEPGLGLIYKLDPTPGRHTQGNQYAKPVDLPYDMPDFGQDPLQQMGRGKHLRVVNSLNHVLQASGLCQFGYCSTRYPFTYEFLSAITGHEYTLEETYIVGDRISNIRHAFNLREGDQSVEAGDSGASLRTTAASGWAHCERCSRYGHDGSRIPGDYGLDAQTAKPSRAKLAELGLQDVAEVLYNQ